MGSRENECQISQNYIKFTEIYNSCEIWRSFSRIPVRNFLWCYYRWLITSLGLKKYKKEGNILVQGFCPLSRGFRLKNISPLFLTCFVARTTCQGLSASPSKGILQRDEKVHYRSGNEGNFLYGKWIIVTFHLIQLFTTETKFNWVNTQYQKISILFVQLIFYLLEEITIVCLNSTV